MLYGSQTNNARSFAFKLGQKYAVQHSPLPVRVTAMDEFEPDNLAKCAYVVIIVSTYTDGTPPANARLFCQWLDDAVNDFRLQKGSHSKVRYTVFGLGSSDYGKNFNAVGKQIKFGMKALGAKLLCKHGIADYSDSREGDKTPEQVFEEWALNTLLPAIKAQNQKVKEAETERTYAKKASEARSNLLDAEEKEEEEAESDAAEDDEEDEEDDDDGFDDEYEYEYIDVPVDEAGNIIVMEEGEGDGTEVGEPGSGPLLDLEDLDKAIPRTTGPSTTATASAPAADEEAGGVRRIKRVIIRKKNVQTGEIVEQRAVKPRKMLTDKQRSSLTKQGYKIIGSHSGVKLCRWTKAMLRGRGGCYKHTFYGIVSYQCMEMTPSLACANKCVFCWRHHTNPVGTAWKWEADSPNMILEGALDNHRRMIGMLKGVPGVQPQRFKDALTPRHCALSLVGEPIMYPYINEFLDLLHSQGISSFLVTNAQFPEQLRTLQPVTQLYLSIDGYSPESLKKVDRPLNADYWERYIECMRILREKKVRTVYRLTLVKDFNMAEVAEYARLVAIGMPTFIEVKGVTFCGTGGGVRMSHVPFHQEVREFCQRMCDYLDGRYELACEHEHSCCVLISDKKLKSADGTWNTWIDYPKFQELVRRYKEEGVEFGVEDYCAPTPSWAVFGAAEAGFSPNETRVRNKGKYSKAARERAAAAEASESKDACCNAGNEEDGACCQASDSSCACKSEADPAASTTVATSGNPEAATSCCGEGCACKQ